MCSFLKAVVTGFAILSFALVSNTQALPTTPHNLKPDFERVGFETPVAGPFAYTHFCLRYQADCRVHNRQFRRPHPVILTSERRRDLIQINQQVNRSIRPKHYLNDVSYDTWRIAPAAGDCNDYAITKRHELLARGWPSRALLLSEVVTSWGEHHLVLLVRTEQQDFILDNLNANIKPWSKAPYTWVRVQSPSEPALWSTIKTANATEARV